MDLARNESEDGTNTPTEKATGTIPPAPNKQHASMILPTPTEKEAGTTQSARTEGEAGSTPERCTNRRQKGTTKRDGPATPGSECSSSNDDNTEDKDYVS
jgi:hypothetical protein